MITIIDYGLGNVRAFLNVYRRLNIPANTAKGPDELRGASKLILPGVGSFDHAMGQLARSGMREVLDQLVLRDGIPVLGVCVGMQMLARSSEEGTCPGLGWLSGSVKALRSAVAAGELRLPHMGWNDVRPVCGGDLFDGLAPSSRFYFLHSYYFQVDLHEDVAAVASYGVEFTCAVRRGNILGVQFHPEKSHRSGTRLLENFARMTC